MFIHTIRELKLSADQINAQITYLEIRKTLLSAMENFTCNITGASEESDKLSGVISGNVSSLMMQRCECVKTGGSGADCDKFLQGIHSINQATDSTALSLIAVKGLDAFEGNPNAIKSEIDNIDQKLVSLKNELIGVGYALPGFASAPLGPQPPPKGKGNWFKFEYNSKTETEKEDANSQQTEVSVGFSIKPKRAKFSFGGSGSYTKQTEENFNSLNTEDYRVSGELLRVSVRMPWFRPELFDEKQLIMVRKIYISLLMRYCF